MHHTRFASIVCASLLIALLLSGCASYQLRGVVVEGRNPGVYVVDANDPQLKQTGVADARIQVLLDPEKIRSKALAMVMTDDYGRFAVGVDDPGAGLLEYSMQVLCDAEGYGPPPSQVMPLPGAGKQVLVVMSAGRGKAPRRSTEPKEDILDEVEKFKKQFE